MLLASVLELIHDSVRSKLIFSYNSTNSLILIKYPKSVEWKGEREKEIIIKYVFFLIQKNPESIPAKLAEGKQLSIILPIHSLVCEASITVWQCYRCWGQKRYQIPEFFIDNAIIDGRGVFLQKFYLWTKHMLNFFWRVNYCYCPSWAFSPFVYIGPTGESFGPCMYLSTSLLRDRG